MILVILRRLTAFGLLLFSILSADAQGNASGVVQVPICGDGAFQVGEGTIYGEMWVGGPQALEEPLTAADLNLLRGKPGFAGLTDAQIQTKMIKIRKEVWEAIDLIGLLDVRLALRLESLFLNRRISLEFSNRQIGGALDRNSLGHLAEDSDNGALSIKNYPCDTVTDFDISFVVMLGTLIHEGTHLSQTWPDAYRNLLDMNWRHWREEMEKRYLFQCNEIASSEKEKTVIFGLFLAMRGIKRDGKIPDDNAATGTVIPPLARAIAQKFLDTVPAAERTQKTDALVKALTPHVDRINSVLSCRRLVKTKVGELRDRPAPQNNQEMLPLQQEWIAFIQTTGWFQQIGDAVLNGVFSLDLIAGGSGAEANQVRQYDHLGDPRIITVPGLSVITDVAYVNDRAILVGGLSATAGQGAIYSLRDVNMDDLLDPASLNLITSMSGLSRGVSLACDPVNGRGFCLGRQTGNLYTLTPPPPALPTSLTFQLSTNSAPILDENFFLHLPPGGNKLFFVPDFGGCITEATQWSSAPAIGTIANNFRIHRPVVEYPVPPVFLDPVFRGDSYVRFGATPDREIKLFNDAVTPAALLGTTMTDSSGTGLFRIPAITGAPLLRLNDAIYGDSATFTPGPPITDPNTVLLPPGFYVPGNSFPIVDPPIFFAPPHREIKLDFSERMSWSSGHTATTTIGSNAFTDISPDLPLLNMPRTGFWRAQWLGRNDIVPDSRIFTIPAAMTTAIDLRLQEFDFGAVNGQSNATYTVIDRDGLHEDLAFITPGTATLNITPLMLANTVSGSPTVLKVRRTDIVDGKTQDFLITTYSNRRALIEPKDTGSFLLVPCQLLSGGSYPIYQFTLSNNPADLCTDPHWHAPPFFSAYSLENSSTATPEPPVDCGWGTVELVPIALCPLTYAAWAAFVNAHPPSPYLFN